ncbi:hypothetical protein EJ03DRAFT_336322 [Teratosphaeria nubilosa]|uniref:Uncharacterized protein n=1 Tax=Teratosphaeria nubilosa TaxID=161662 RepID=A0A6G1L8T5_9PEZI|nr:hypothetical protein EJ03DRAFT_336322 [Teratosphaeria nubilosa]
MHLKQILLALTATSGLALAAPQTVQDANAHNAPHKRAEKPAPAPKFAGESRTQPARSWVLTGYTTGDCSEDQFDNQSAPAYSDNLVQGCLAFDADNSPSSLTFDGDGAWQLYLFEDENCQTGDEPYQGEGSIDANDRTCYDSRGMPFQEPNARRLTSTDYLDYRQAMGCSVQAHRHIFVGSTKPHVTQSVPVRITTASPSAARSWKAKLNRASESPEEARYRSAIDLALQMTNKTHKTLVRPSASFEEFEQEMRVRYFNAIEAYFDRCQIPDESCWDMIKLLASEWEELKLELCFRLGDAVETLINIDELPPPYESLESA